MLVTPTRRLVQVYPTVPAYGALAMEIIPHQRTATRTTSCV